ncbi:MAG: dynamin family protein [Candidatus Riflebacteria bacterium]|nr:dynamin family protein [Candidatus Riflebacteria bacterium]
MDLSDFRNFKSSFFLLLDETKSIIEKAEFKDLLPKLDNIFEKLSEERFYISVIGEIKRGKSTLINAMVGKEILPKAATICTAALTILRYGRSPTAKIKYQSGLEENVQIEELKNVVTKKNPKVAEIAFVEIFFPLDLLANGIVIVDTPGVNDSNEFRRRVTEEFIPRSDGVLFVLNAGQPLSDSEKSFLSDEIIGNNIKKIWIVLNAIDRIEDVAGKKEAIDFCRDNLKEIIGKVKIFPVSSKLALKGFIENNPTQTAESGFSDFFKTFSHELISSKRDILFEIPCGKFLTLLGEIEAGVKISLEFLENKKKLNNEEIQNRFKEIEEKRKICRIKLENFSRQIETIIYENFDFPQLDKFEIERNLLKILDSDHDTNSKKDAIEGVLRSKIQTDLSTIISKINSEALVLAESVKEEFLKILNNKESHPNGSSVSHLKLPFTPFFPETSLSFGGKNILSNFGRMASLFFIFQGNVPYAAISLIAGFFGKLSAKDLPLITLEFESKYNIACEKIKSEVQKTKSLMVEYFKNGFEKQISGHFLFLEGLINELYQNKNQSEEYIASRKRFFHEMGISISKIKNDLVQIYSQVSIV